MTRWRDDKLDLGNGWMLSIIREEGGWCWYMTSPGADAGCWSVFKSEGAAQRAAERWIYQARKQMGKYQIGKKKRALKAGE